MNLDVLDAPVSKHEVEAFLESHPVKKSFFSVNRDTITTAVILAAVGVVIVVTLQNAGAVGQIVSMIFALVFVITIILLVYYSRLYARKNAETGLRVMRMAKSNNWRYTYRDAIFRHPTAFFTAGRDYEFTNVVEGPDFEAGQFSYTIGSGRSERKMQYGYMIVPLHKKLPHMLLDGKSNNLRLFGMDITNIPINYKKNQIDLLEGDFNEHFNLYAPEGYSVDVRYIFTPDLMKVLVEESESIDVEILDSNVFVYFGKYNVNDKTFWEKVDRLRVALNDKLVAKSVRYEDDRGVNGSVAVSGRRLQTAFPIFATMMAIIYIIVQLIDLIGAIVDK